VEQQARSSAPVRPLHSHAGNELGVRASKRSSSVQRPALRGEQRSTSEQSRPRGSSVPPPRGSSGPASVSKHQMRHRAKRPWDDSSNRRLPRARVQRAHDRPWPEGVRGAGWLKKGPRPDCWVVCLLGRRVVSSTTSVRILFFCAQGPGAVPPPWRFIIHHTLGGHDANQHRSFFFLFFHSH
jgi:hypothetical protein